MRSVRPFRRAAPGPTRRNAPLYGPPGYAYVYLNYGIHPLVNVVTEADGDPAAVRTAVELARPRSMLTVLATAPVAIGGVLAREVAILGVAGAHPDLVVEAAAMCVKGEIDLLRGTTENASDPLRTHVRTLR